MQVKVDNAANTEKKIYNGAAEQYWDWDGSDWELRSPKVFVSTPVGTIGRLRQPRIYGPRNAGRSRPRSHEWSDL